MTESAPHPGGATEDPLVGRATALFRFLGGALRLRSRPPRTVDAYEQVVWLAELPHHPAVTVAYRHGEPDPADSLLTVDRVGHVAPPPPGESLTPWLAGPWDDPDRQPELRDAIEISDANESTPAEPEMSSGDADRSPRALSDHPEIRAGYDQWRAEWRLWADQELTDRPVRERYKELFRAYLAATGRSEELELVVGIGCLGWQPDGGQPVRRHLLIAPAMIRLDDDTGRLTVDPIGSPDPVTVELDMLEPRLTTTAGINDVRAAARDFAAHPLHRAATAALVRRLVHVVDADGQYEDTDLPPAAGPHAVAAFAPAIIVRRRSGQGLVDIFHTIVEQLTGPGHVPDGVSALLHPEHPPVASSVDAAPRDGDGALVDVDGEPFLPMPVNDVQLRIIDRVGSHQHTLVQGPPGTGKTHTAAALLSHLLAQGKRVLVTAHTDRALREVRDKLPAEIRPLSVAVVGTSRDDLADLKTAVDTISARSDEHDHQLAQAKIEGCLATIEVLRRRRAELYRMLLDAREQEVREYEHAGYAGTMAAIAQRHRAEAARFEWLVRYVSVGATDVPPAAAELLEWRGYLLDATLAPDEPDARQRLVEPNAVFDPDAFADLVGAQHAAEAANERYSAMRGHPAFAAVHGLDGEVRARIRDRLHGLAETADELARRPEAWMNDALGDVLVGRDGIWRSRGQQVDELIRRAGLAVEQMDPVIEVEISGDANTGALVALAGEVLTFVRSGGSIKTMPDGSPKLGPLAPKMVKRAQPLFTTVRVDGLPPTTSDQLAAFVAWVAAGKTLAALDRAWPAGTVVPAEDSAHERLLWHVTEAEQLHRVLELADELHAERQRLVELGLPRPDWTDLAAVRGYADLVEAATAADDLARVTEPMRRLSETLGEAARWSTAAPCVANLWQAVEQRDHNGYADAYRRLVRLHTVRRSAARRDELAGRLAAVVPVLCQAIEHEPAAPEWDDRLAGFGAAWAWCATGTWIRSQDRTDGNAVQGEITDVEIRIRKAVEILAAERAWDHAVSPGRLSPGARADLEQYSYLVRKLGKGTGTYAAQRKADVRRALDRCRPAVPVWIMPIYRIAEQLRIQPDMFDVVIVDEASQAGLEAMFLHYMAPKIVVIGDDKQVSPAAVGVNQQELRDLAVQYLADDRYRESWQDPQCSLFDAAKMRYSGRITLIEHRRCVPEIIEFSNRIAYEPENIRLIPVREYGTDRLEPIRAVFLPDGYQRGRTGERVNPVEVDAVVEAIQKCVADPRYDGKSFGVISLLGQRQAKLIEAALLERIPEEEWIARHLRCGDAADFQGSERDVMFLSMVAATNDAETRLYPLTHERYVQRYNVAVSRARDQAWVFHSVRASDLGNPEDMRFRLLDYCQEVVARESRDADAVPVAAVPEDRLVDPFDSVFEQRVYNRLVGLGYLVHPQYPVGRDKIDLVVLGPKTRLAVECDSDRWHGPEAYARDLARQRDLQRCGWRFFRVRESAFTIDPDAVLGRLTTVLREHDIIPAAATRVSDERPGAVALPERDSGPPDGREW